MTHKKVFIASDIHYPFHHKPSVEIAKKVCKDVKPDYFVYGGDNIDAAGISKFTAKTIDSGIEDTIKEIEGFKKLHQEFVKVAPKAQFLWCLGNHDGQRITDLLNKLEERGDYSLLAYCKDKLDLRKEFPDVKFCDYNDFHKIGKIRFTHGEFCNDASAKKHAVSWAGNLVYFHCFDEETELLTQNGWVKCINVTQKDEVFTYNIDKKIGEFNSVNGNFNLYPIQINARRCIFNNKIYEAK